MGAKLNRRSFMGKSLGVSAGVLAGLGFEHQALLGQLVDRAEYGKIKEPVKGLQRGKLGKYEVSRMIIGGNLISGSAHAGDLIYQSALMTHYFTTEKIFETWSLAEMNGINTTLMRADPHIIGHYQKYLKEKGGKLQWIAQTAPEQGDPLENARLAADSGAFAVYYHGGVCDGLVKNNKIDEIGKVVAGIKKLGILAGVGGHRLETVKASETAGLAPDFYMYTVNKVDYMSTKPEEIEPYMKTLNRPWIGFKVLGAGRDKPGEGFMHAFQKGADFICVGMFDWQVRDDIAMVQEMLAKGIERERPWRA